MAEITPLVDSNNYRFELESATGKINEFPAEIYENSVVRSTLIGTFGSVGTYTLSLVESQNSENESVVATNDLITRSFDFDQDWPELDEPDYKGMLRNPDDHRGSYRISGIVNQAVAYDYEYNNIPGKWNRYVIILNGSDDDRVEMRMDADKFERLLEEDQVDIYGYFEGVGKVTLVDNEVVYRPHFNSYGLRRN